MDATDELPAELRLTSRRNTRIAPLVICALFTVGGLAMVATGGPVAEIVIATAFFALGTAVLGWAFARPNAVLMLAPDGFTLAAHGRTTRWRWDEVSAFRLASQKHGGVIASQVIAFDEPARTGAAAALARKMTGASSALESVWHGSAAETVAVMNAFRDRAM